MKAERGTRNAGRGALLVAALAWATSSAGAQDFTLGAMLDSLRRGAALARLDSVDSVANKKLDSIAAVLTDAGARPIQIKTLAAVITGSRLRLADAHRLDRGSASLLGQAWFRGAILLLPKIANGSLADPLDARAPSEADGLLAPTEALRQQVQDNAIAQGSEKLRKLGIKYGEGSPSLNVVEATVNYLFQWVPGLRSSKDGTPSRYEFLAAYRTAEMTHVKGPPGCNCGSWRLMAANQIGLRWYHWDPAWGHGSAKAQALRPRYASAGVYLQDDYGNAPLDFPTRFARVGAFIGWGSFHLAYSRAGHRFLFGTDKQIIPHLF